MIRWRYALRQNYQGMVTMRYIMEAQSRGNEQVPQAGVFGLITNTDTALTRWETAIRNLDCEELTTKFERVKLWVDETARSELYRIVSEASIRPSHLLNRIQRKADALWKVCEVLESAPDNSVELYDSLLDWVLDVPRILSRFLHEEPVSSLTKIKPSQYRYSANNQVLRDCHPVAV